MVVTVEPGVYVEGLAGVRIGHCRRLMAVRGPDASKELQVVG
jgi:Xaa-Pro aminopeptidase